MWSVSWASLSQGTIKVYDQMVTYGVPMPGDVHSDFAPIRTNTPFAQSFVPILTEVGFVELTLRYMLYLEPPLSETLYLNLREGSVTGPILGSTPRLTFTYESRDQTFEEVFVQDFIFPAAVGVEPGRNYFVEVVHVSGSDDLMRVAILSPVYAGQPTYYLPGELVMTGKPFRLWDMWFREGILIPEPGSGALMVLGSALLMWHFGCRRIRQPRATTISVKGSVPECRNVDWTITSSGHGGRTSKG